MASAASVALLWRPLPIAPASPVFRSSRRIANSVRPSGTCDSFPRHSCASAATSRSSSGGLCSTTMRDSWRHSFADIHLESLAASFQRPNLKRKSCGPQMIRAGMRLDPGGGNNKPDDGVVRVVVNLVLASGLTYLTITGKLGWLFEAVLSLWLLAILVPVVSLAAVLWLAEREIVKGACPNCGQSFQAFEFALKQQEQNLCPYCAQPFKLDNDKRFVRDEPRFSNDAFGGFREGFGGFGGRSSDSRKQDPGGVIVDVEAEVRDRD